MTEKLAGLHRFYFDGAFLEGRAPRYKDLEAELVADGDSQVVTLLFSQELSFLALLPGEARQLGASLSQLADVLDPPEEEVTP